MHTHDHGRTDAPTDARARTHTHLSEEPLEDIGRKDVPCDRVGDGREDPVEFAHDCLAVVELPGYLFQQRLVHLHECASMRVSMHFVCARVLACMLLQQLLLHRPALCLLCACLHGTCVCMRVRAWVVGCMHAQTQGYGCMGGRISTHNCIHTCIHLCVYTSVHRTGPLGKAYMDEGPSI